MTMQNPFGMGLDVMRQLGVSQSQIAQTQGERQRQQMLQQKAAEQAALAEQQAMQQQQKDLYTMLGNLQALPDVQSRMQAIQASPFAQIEGIDQLMNEQALSNEGLAQIIAASPFEQEVADESLRFGTVNPRDYTPESLAKYQQSGNYADLVRYYPLKQVEIGGIKYFSDDQGQLFLPVTQTAQGDTKPATPEEVASGEAVPSPQPVGQLTPEQQIAQEAELAAAKTTAVEEAKKDVKLSDADQQAYDSAQRTLSTMESIINSPALSANIFTGALGAGSLTPPIPGTPEADFRAYLETLTAQQFTNEISKLKGMGSLSDAEGRKIAAAAASLDLSMSPEAFKRQLQIIKEGLETLAPPGTYENQDADQPISWDELEG